MERNGDSTGRMVDAFIPAGRERDEWRYTLRQIREAHGCPCTTTTPAARKCIAGLWFEMDDLPAGRAVRNCGLCHGVGASIPFADPLPGTLPSSEGT